MADWVTLSDSITGSITGRGYTYTPTYTSTYDFRWLGAGSPYNNISSTVYPWEYYQAYRRAKLFENIKIL